MYTFICERETHRLCVVLLCFCLCLLHDVRPINHELAGSHNKMLCKIVWLCLRSHILPKHMCCRRRWPYTQANTARSTHESIYTYVWFAYRSCVCVCVCRFRRASRVRRLLYNMRFGALLLHVCPNGWVNVSMCMPTTATTTMANDGSIRHASTTSHANAEVKPQTSPVRWKRYGYKRHGKLTQHLHTFNWTMGTFAVRYIRFLPTHHHSPPCDTLRKYK